MNTFDLLFFGLCALLVLVGGVITVGAKNPIRGAMGLLGTILGIAGNYLLLDAELLATMQVLVYAGAVVILFVFVIMILGPSAESPRDARSAIPRYLGAGVLIATALGALGLLLPKADAALTAFKAAPANFGTIEGLGSELYTKDLVPFELSGALLLVAVIGAVAVARGKQIDPTALRGADKPSAAPKKEAPAHPEAHS
jgi:NADH-quinone oxidoreductase subunit J